MTKRILVVCYSRGGTTLKVAKHLAESMGADLDPIEEHAPREGVGGYLRSLLEAVAKGLPAIRTRHDPRDYDLVVVGTPVWAGTMSSPVRSYLYAHRRHLENVAFFAVMGGRGADSTVSEMRLATSAPHAPTCTFTQAEVERDRHRTPCDQFIRRLQEGAPRTDRGSDVVPGTPVDFRARPVGA